MPIFIRTDSKLIDVDKITFVDIRELSASTIYFGDGRSLQMSPEETHTLLCAMYELGRAGRLVAVQAARITPMTELTPVAKQQKRKTYQPAESTKQ